jgi:hypothetical protein
MVVVVAGNVVDVDAGRVVVVVCVVAVADVDDVVDTDIVVFGASSSSVP